jgi:hypothetical protein
MYRKVGAITVTDQQKLTDLLTGWDVHYEVHQKKDGNTAVFVLDSLNDDNQTDKVTGYTGFFTKYVFSPDGTFIEMGAWE